MHANVAGARWEWGHLLWGWSGNGLKMSAGMGTPFCPNATLLFDCLHVCVTTIIDITTTASSNIAIPLGHRAHICEAVTVHYHHHAQFVFLKMAAKASQRHRSTFGFEFGDVTSTEVEMTSSNLEPIRQFAAHITSFGFYFNS